MSISSFSSKRIFLIGYMGSGKSTLGSALADRLSYLHVDTDDAIEAYTGMSINEIFKKQGEPHFRAYEMMLFFLVTELDKVVISTGGGLPMNKRVMDKMLHSGVTIYLNCPVSELTKRISSSSERPLHKTRDQDSLTYEIDKRLSERRPVYEEAHLTINSQNIPVAQKKILSLL